MNLLYGPSKMLAKLFSTLFRSARDNAGAIWDRYLKLLADSLLNEIYLENEARFLCIFLMLLIGRKRLDNILHCLNVIRRDGIPGDLAETGVWRGGACILMRGYLAAWNLDKTVWVADSFEGMPKPSLPQDAGHDFSAAIIPILSVSARRPTT